MSPDSDFSYRIGQGVDIHRMVEGRKLILAGLEIPYHLGLLGHSDADALVHSIIDALLGAAALGDIGQHFPDTDARWKDVCSIELLEKVLELLATRNWQLVNVDSSIMLQAPKLAGYILAMRESLARSLKISLDCISIKATTAEGLGFVGEGQGIQVQSIVMLKRKTG